MEARVLPARCRLCPGRRSGSGGFTLTEALVGLALSLVIVGFLFSAVWTLNRTHRRLIIRHDRVDAPMRELRRLGEELESAGDPLPDEPAMRSAQPPDDDGRQTMLSWFGAVADRPGEWGRVELQWVPSPGGPGGMLQKVYQPLPGAETAWTSFPRSVMSVPAAPRVFFFDGTGWFDRWPPEARDRTPARLPQGVRIEWDETDDPARRASPLDPRALRMEVALPVAQVVTSRIQRAAQASPSAPETGAPAP